MHKPTAILLGVLLITFSLILGSCEFPTNDAGIKGFSCMLASFLTTPVKGMEVGIGHPNLGGTSVAQSFIVNKNGKAISFSVKLQRQGTFQVGMHTITGTIEGNTLNGLNLGEPDDKPMGTSASLDVSQVSVAGDTYTFKFDKEISLSTSTIYWLRLKGSYPLSTTNYISWSGYDGKTGKYSVDNVTLHAVYETGQSTHVEFSNAAIGSYRFLYFDIGC